MCMPLLKQLVCAETNPQVAFAWEAAQLLCKDREVRARATNQGLSLIAETEIALGAALRRLRAHYGDSISAAPPAVRYDECPPDTEPVMLVKVKCPARYRGIIRANLLWRGASIRALRGYPDSVSITAVAPLRELLGLPDELAALSANSATLHMEFSHFRDLVPDPESPGAA